jgi:hypothetical protein
MEIPRISNLRIVSKLGFCRMNGEIENILVLSDSVQCDKLNMISAISVEHPSEMTKSEVKQSN